MIIEIAVTTQSGELKPPSHYQHHNNEFLNEQRTNVFLQWGAIMTALKSDTGSESNDGVIKNVSKTLYVFHGM
jgi:hypothetical protein